jgi:hypothetical protein
MILKMKRKRHLFPPKKKKKLNIKFKKVKKIKKNKKEKKILNEYLLGTKKTTPKKKNINKKYDIF